MNQNELESFEVCGIVMEGYDARFKELFEQLFATKDTFNSLIPKNDIYSWVRWGHFVDSLFFGQLETLSYTDDHEFIGSYVVEFFSARFDDQLFGM